MKNYTTDKLSIKSWAEADQPREKMIAKGRQHLSDAELIAILLGSGNTEESAVTLAKRILNTYQGDLDTLGQVNKLLAIAFSVQRIKCLRCYKKTRL